MRKCIGAAAFVAMVFTALSASAQPNDPYDYPYCLQGRDYGYPGLCQFRATGNARLRPPEHFRIVVRTLDLHTDCIRAAGDLTRCDDRPGLR